MHLISYVYISHRSKDRDNSLHRFNAEGEEKKTQKRAQERLFVNCAWIWLVYGALSEGFGGKLT